MVGIAPGFQAMTRISQSLLLVPLLAGCPAAANVSQTPEPAPPNLANGPIESEHGVRPAVDHIGPIEFCGSEYPRDAKRVDCDDPKVTSIDQLAALTELRELFLDDTSVADLSPLASCTMLDRLSIRRTKVRNLDVLAGIPSLTALNMQGLSIPPEEIAALTQIRGLGVTVTVESLDALAPLDLYELLIESETVTDISALSGKSFGLLILDLSRITDVSPLATSRVEMLDLVAPLLADISPLFQIEGLERLRLSTGPQIGPPAKCEIEGLTYLEVSIHGSLSKDIVPQLGLCAAVFHYSEW